MIHMNEGGTVLPTEPTKQEYAASTAASVQRRTESARENARKKRARAVLFIPFLAGVAIAGITIMKDNSYSYWPELLGAVFLMCPFFATFDWWL